MKKLHSFVFYGLVTPAITLGAGSVLAEQSSYGQDADREQRKTQHEQDATRSTPGATHGDQSKERAQHSGSKTAADYQDKRDPSHKQNRGFMSSAPENGMQASELIGAEVRTSGDDIVGSVNDLILDEDGQVAAIVVSAGGFLGMGERDVAIGWDDVTKSGSSDELKLQIDVTRESLRDAPAFETQE